MPGKSGLWARPFNNLDGRRPATGSPTVCDPADLGEDRDALLTMESHQL